MKYISIELTEDDSKQIDKFVKLTPFANKRASAIRELLRKVLPIEIAKLQTKS